MFLMFLIFFSREALFRQEGWPSALFSTISVLLRMKVYSDISAGHVAFRVCHLHINHITRERKTFVLFVDVGFGQAVRRLEGVSGMVPVVQCGKQPYGRTIRHNIERESASSQHPERWLLYVASLSLSCCFIYSYVRCPREHQAL